MISALWLIPAAMAGATFGVLVFACIVAAKELDAETEEQR